ncbi:hypothetical protein KAI87_09470, partial [Myxococcota bacterium]|nr:hypothetical protein [Myxococcota bacterium]
LSSSFENMQITSPDSDGDLKKGVMVGLNVGYLAADQRRIWGYDFTCSQDSECGTDFVCGVGGLCIYSPPASDNPDGQSDDDPSTTPYDPEDEGCGCTTAEPVWFMMLFGFFGMRRRIK